MPVFKNIRNKIITFLYKRIMKPLLFLQDPEVVHDRFLNTARILGKNALFRQTATCMFGYNNVALRQEIMGITYENPIGLAAGFDKDAMLINILPSVGFGFEEVGSVTGIPCNGNQKPRLWRLKKSESLQVYYGLNNEGSKKIAKILERRRKKSHYG